MSARWLAYYEERHESALRGYHAETDPGHRAANAHAQLAYWRDEIALAEPDCRILVRTTAAFWAALVATERAAAELRLTFLLARSAA